MNDEWELIMNEHKAAMKLLNEWIMNSVIEIERLAWMTAAGATNLR